MDTIADAGATCGPTPAHATSPSRRPSHAASAQATAAARPSPHPRSEITSASRRSAPITRSPAVSRRARSAAPIPEAEPVTAMTRTRTLLYLRGGARATDSRAGERCGGLDSPLREESRYRELGDVASENILLHLGPKHQAATLLADLSLPIDDEFAAAALATAHCVSHMYL